jgi:signal transduction histidine kinase
MIRNESGIIIDAHTILANTTSSKFTMVPLDQMLSKNVSEIDPGILSSPLFGQAMQTLGTGTPFIAQYFLEPTGRWLEISVAKMDENRLINIFTDVTKLKNVQLEIERSEERLKAVFNNAQSGMFTFTPVKDESGEITDFRFVITNYYFAAYVNQVPEVLNGDLGSKWFPGYLHNGVFDMYKKTFLTGESLHMDKHYHVDGLDLYLDLKSTRVGGEVLVTFIDNTPLKTAQLQLEKYVEELKRSNANLEDFAYAASHDLKEPIRKIRVFSDRVQAMLADRLLPEEKNYFLLIEKATIRMQNLIDDLLEYSHVAAPMNYIDNLDLNAKVSQVLEDLELEIKEKQANIIIGRLPQIQGHRRQIQQLFQNLISNALKFCKPGVPPEIRISSSVVVAGKQNVIPFIDAYDNSLYNEIVVSDNGIGFQQEYADIIFKMFQRLHGQAEFEGTGIGLAIVRKVVENHKGFISAESKPGEGATFRILFPVN